MANYSRYSVSVAALGGIWPFIALGPPAGFALIWAGFIAAGCFFAAGGDTKALTKTIVGIAYGAVVRLDRAFDHRQSFLCRRLGTGWPAIVVRVTVSFSLSLPPPIYSPVSRPI
jgi:Protein of unknown function (DUF1097)